MDSKNILEIEQERLELLKKYKLDEESNLEFRSTIKKVSEEEADKLGKKLYNIINKKDYNEKDDTQFDEVVNLVFDGANLEYKTSQKKIFPLLVCCRKGYIKTFILLVRAGANVNQVNDYGTTCCMAAARHNYVRILNLLILLRADINARCSDGDTALFSAKIHNSKEAFQALVQAGSYLGNRNSLNQTIFDVNPSSSLTIDSKFIADKNLSVPSVSFQDTQDLLEEASQKMKQILQKK